MLVRCSVALALVASPVAADTLPDEVPGTGGDPIVALTATPSVVDAPLVPGIAVRGADPDDTKVLFDDFELPVLFHGDRALRSTLIGDAVSNVSSVHDGVEYGPSTTFLTIASPLSVPRQVLTFTDNDVSMITPGTRHLPFDIAALRVGDFLDQPLHDDFLLTARYVTTRWFSTVSYIGGLDNDKDVGNWGRVVGRTIYHVGTWRSSLAVSPGYGPKETNLDARYMVQHSSPAGGLRRVTWRSGLDSTNTSHTVPVDLWTNDLGIWSTVTAMMTKHITATGGVRVDAFLRTGDVATQPRASIEATFGGTDVKLAAGAYRRPPERATELVVDTLHPERTTQVTATLGHTLKSGDDAITGAITGFYIDLSHLVALDSFGRIGNTGFGTSKGIELMTLGKRGHWVGYVGFAISSARRHAYFRSADLPATYDQPLRVDSIVRYNAKRWRVAARFSLSSGLPYTPIVETTYDADADTYTPSFGRTNSARLPLMHSLDVRVDLRLGRALSAFVELRNAYAASTALGYAYSYDYKQRLDITLPILPLVGIRGELSMPTARQRTPQIKGGVIAEQERAR